jgi:hypothetical protein
VVQGLDRDFGGGCCRGVEDDERASLDSDVAGLGLGRRTRTLKSVLWGFSIKLLNCSIWNKEFVVILLSKAQDRKQRHSQQNTIFWACILYGVADFDLALAFLCMEWFQFTFTI